MTLDTRRAVLVTGSLVTGFAVLRLMLHLSPDADFMVGGYNVHHLFPGLLLITAGGIPLALVPGRHPFVDVSAVAFGLGLGMALDEWVYLIVTDGSNAAYLLPVSFWGGAVMIALACAYVITLWRVSARCDAKQRDPDRRRAEE